MEVKTTGVTSMLQEACVSKSVGAIEPESNINLDPSLQNLTRYFERPRYVTTFHFPNTRGYIFGRDITTDELFNNIFPSGYTRLMGAYGMKFTMVFHLQVAATPFHCGLAALSWQYCPTPGSDVFGTWHRGNESFSCTNLPHVRMDIGKETMVSLRVPFLHSEEFVRVSGNDRTPSTLGKVTVCSLMPTVLAASQVAPTMKLLMHLEDIEFFGAAPQESTTVTLQSGLNKEFESDAYPMSSSLHSASKSVSFIGKAIPSLKSLSGPLSWALGVSAGVLRSFGFSRPVVQEPPSKMLPLATAQENNIDIPTVALPLCPMASNRCAVDSTLGGSDIDQMSLAYVLAQPSQIFCGSLSTSHVTGSTRYGMHVTPANMWFRAHGTCNNPIPLVATNPNFNCVMPSGLAYFASMFRFWRGSVTYRFTFAKTPYHGGRLLFSYIPYMGKSPSQGEQVVLVPGNVNGGPQPFGISAILDLRDKNVFEFTVPYSASTPYLPFTKPMGDVALTVVDALIAPATVAQEISFLVEVFSKDMELACPVAPRFAPMPSGGNVQLESGLSNTMSDGINQTTIGEHIVSLKQLIQLPKWTGWEVARAHSQGFYILPWWHQPRQWTSANSERPWPETFGFGGCIATCYSFVRGSTDAHIYFKGDYPNKFGSDWFLLMAQVVAMDGGATSTSSTWLNSPDSSVQRIMSDSKSLHVHIPNYGMVQRYDPGIINANFGATRRWSIAPVTTPVDSFHARAETTPAISVTSGNSQDYSRRPPLNVASVNVTTPLTSVADGVFSIAVSRQAGDDAYASMYIGPPMILLPPSDAAGYDADWPFKTVGYTQPTSATLADPENDSFEQVAKSLEPYYAAFLKSED